MIIRTLLIFATTFCGLIASNGDVAQIANNATIHIGTNVVCKLLIKQTGTNYSAPIAIVLISNTSSKRLGAANVPIEMLFDINLTGDHDQLVEKTEYGKMFGHSLTQNEVNDLFLPQRVAHGSIAACMLVEPGETLRVGSISLPKAFKISKPGEYDLQVRVRLLQTCVSDATGTIRTNILDGQFFGASRTSPTTFQSVWLPSVSTNLIVH